MSTCVAVVNTPILVFHGLVQALESSGYIVESTDRPHAWVRSHPNQAMLVGIHDDGDVDLIRDLVSAQTALVALVDQPSPRRLRMCFHAGARACASMDWSGDEVALALDAGKRGWALLPAAMARDLIATREMQGRARSLSGSQQWWLRQLASGITVHELAQQVGFSERETYRRLRRIYDTMGVRGRTQALILASASGILEGGPLRNSD